MTAGIGYSSYTEQEMTLLAERVRDDGMVLRAHLGPNWGQYEAKFDADYFGEEEDSWRPAAWCNPTADVRVAVAGGGVIDLGTVGWYHDPYEGGAISSLLLGVTDGAPIWVVVVQAPEGTTEVRVSDPNGVEDVTAPTNGVALLALPGPDVGPKQVWSQRPTYEVTFDGGDDPVPVAAGEVGYVGDEGYRAGCYPPPAGLPAPGEQPARPRAAKAEIVETMTALYMGGEPETDHLRLDNTRGVDQARQQVADGPYVEAASTAEVYVEDVVFTSPEEATFRYRLETSAGVFLERFGDARVVDGTWRITRRTFCDDLSLAGGSCAVDPWDESQHPPAGTGSGE